MPEPFDGDCFGFVVGSGDEVGFAGGLLGSVVGFSLVGFWVLVDVLVDVEDGGAGLVDWVVVCVLVTTTGGGPGASEVVVTVGVGRGEAT